MVAPEGVLKDGPTVIVDVSTVDGRTDEAGAPEVEGEVKEEPEPSADVVFGNVSNQPDPENSPHPAKL